jgi:3-phosphoinositide dependent protein kinase-1
MSAPPADAAPAAAAAQGARRQKRMVDFNVLEVIGQGAFGEVREVEDKETGKHYAMKVLSKTHIVREKKMSYVKIERDVFAKLNHANITRLILSFQDPGNLYYCIDLAKNGDLQHKLAKLYALDPAVAKPILGQVLLALAHIHKHRILHRDLKPENVLLDEKNRVKVTDFGTAKIFGPDGPFYVERGSFVGSADYVCPETLKESRVGPESDLWSFGCLIYALLVGVAPFHADSAYQIFTLIENAQYTFPDFVPADAKDLITKILVIEPSDRLGSGTFEDDYRPIREHPFFAGIDWDALPKESVPEFVAFAPAVAARAARTKERTILAEGEIIMREGSAVLEADGEKKQLTVVLTDQKRLLLADTNKQAVLFEVPLVVGVEIEIKGNALVLTGGDDSFALIMEEQELPGWRDACKVELNR